MRPNPFVPLPANRVRLIEAAALLALADHAAGQADARWRVELLDLARVSRALADEGIGPEAADLADRALRELDGGHPGAGTLQEMAAAAVDQLRAANVRQFQRAQERARRWVATTPLPDR